MAFSVLAVFHEGLFQITSLLNIFVCRASVAAAGPGTPDSGDWYRDQGSGRQEELGHLVQRQLQQRHQDMVLLQGR